MLKKEDFSLARVEFPQTMGKDFQSEVDFLTGQLSEVQLSELATFLDLSEHGIGVDWSVAPFYQSLLACKQFSCPGL